ncbi:XRE family transcriptional regulator [Lacticaseibacillus paracasei]|uniref:helix-turn-helix domain-containing protein n=1 Tax=Lacticaseibacillus paracasei TaxID=1597 RepID=UPI000680673D|nr:helix-turn-helix transcriptional regulator [Lacticaseibacillus paracasei]AKU35452.1 XRE family transcriptional regulator [Lacticaseibacillus paracasei]OPH01539.1 transcriptional regulator [Lacticaseibacillus paracasei]
MNIGERIAMLRKERGWNQQQLADKINVSQSTLAMWETDKRRPNTDALNDLADIFNVSLDFLMCRTNKRRYFELTDKDTKDIAKQAQQIIDGMNADASVNFYGEPMTNEQKQSMKDIIEMGLRINREKAKKKFTPKKFRDTGGD